MLCDLPDDVWKEILRFVVVPRRSVIVCEKGQYFHPRWAVCVPQVSVCKLVSKEWKRLVEEAFDHSFDDNRPLLWNKYRGYSLEMDRLYADSRVSLLSKKTCVLYAAYYPECTFGVAFAWPSFRNGGNTTNFLPGVACDGCQTRAVGSLRRLISHTLGKVYRLPLWGFPKLMTFEVLSVPCENICTAWHNFCPTLAKSNPVRALTGSASGASFIDYLQMLVITARNTDESPTQHFVTTLLKQMHMFDFLLVCSAWPGSFDEKRCGCSCCRDLFVMQPRVLEQLRSSTYQHCVRRFSDDEIHWEVGTTKQQ